ncbi:hypothetical protein [Methylobacterium mesophilicum]|uniref:hypothetical protein n=1 Tax=Methylobacterium mesophilicum TaxID=39956 RepID=UPI002F34EFCF
MAARQQFALPEGFEAALTPWLAQRSRADDWSNAREMRTLLEKAREAQAARVRCAAPAPRSRIASRPWKEGRPCRPSASF